MNTQITMEEWLAATPPKFSGNTFDEKNDRHRLESQFMRVFALMKDGQWRTLAEIREVVGGSEAGISARLRDYRKCPYSRTVEKRLRDNPERGLWEYRLVIGS